MNLTSRISFSRSPTFLHPIHVRTASLVSVTSLGVVTALITKSAVPSSVVDVRAVLGPALLILTCAYTANLNRCGVGDNVNTPAGELGC